MAVETVPVATLRVWLTEAQSAYQRIAVGKSLRVVVDSNGERMEFTAASLDKLRTHIRDLQARIAPFDGQQPAYARPFNFVF